MHVKDDLIRHYQWLRIHSCSDAYNSNALVRNLDIACSIGKTPASEVPLNATEAVSDMLMHFPQLYMTTAHMPQLIPSTWRTNGRVCLNCPPKPDFWCDKPEL